MMLILMMMTVAGTGSREGRHDMTRGAQLNYTPVVPLCWAGKTLSGIDNAALKELSIANRDKKKPGCQPNDANYEDIHLDPSILRSDALDKLLAEVETAIQEVALIPLNLEGSVVWGSIRVKGQSLAYHDHEDPKSPNSDRLSFVYYVQANADNQPLAFPITLHAHRFDRTDALPDPSQKSDGPPHQRRAELLPNQK